MNQDEMDMLLQILMTYILEHIPEREIRLTKEEWERHQLAPVNWSWGIEPGGMVFFRINMVPQKPS